MLASAEWLPLRWRLCSAEKRSAGGGARSALRELTCGICLNGAGEDRAVSYAARLPREHRKEPLAQRGALQ